MIVFLKKILGGLLVAISMIYNENFEIVCNS